MLERTQVQATVTAPATIDKAEQALIGKTVLLWNGSSSFRDNFVGKFLVVGFESRGAGDKKCNYIMLGKRITRQGNESIERIRIHINSKVRVV